MPTLTIGGELDGLCRVTRIAEGYQHQVDFAPDFTTAVKTFPVVVNLGQSHWQFASGTPPLLVKERDLKPEITDAQARAEIAKSTTAFMLTRMGDMSQVRCCAPLAQTRHPCPPFACLTHAVAFASGHTCVSTCSWTHWCRWYKPPARL